VRAGLLLWVEGNKLEGLFDKSSRVKYGLKAGFLLKKGRSSTGPRRVAPSRTANDALTSKGGMKAKSGVNTLGGGVL